MKIYNKEGVEISIKDVIVNFIESKAIEHKADKSYVTLSLNGSNISVDLLVTDGTHNWFDELEEIDNEV